MRTGLWIAAALAVALAAGCAGTVRELDSAKRAAAAGDPAANADRAVDCAPADEGCGQLRAIKADACLRLAQDAMAEGRAAEAAPRAACAREHFAAARQSPGADAASLVARELEATRLARESASGAAAAQANADLDALAGSAAAALPGRAEGFHYGADAALWRAAFTPVGDGCDDLAAARRLAAAALAAPPAPSPLPGGVRDAAGAVERRAAALALGRGCP